MEWNGTEQKWGFDNVASMITMLIVNINNVGFNFN
jgi:hypothetical protein